MDIVKWFIANIERPLWFLIRGWTGRLRYEKYLKARFKYTVEENLAEQRKRLLALMNHCIKTVPYYRDFARENGIFPTLDTVIDDLEKFPVLTKADIRAHFKNLRSEKPGKDIFGNTSGGSTGVPVVFLQDKRFEMENSMLTLDGFSGYEIGDKMVQLWGSKQETLTNNAGFKNVVFNKFFYRNQFFNSFCMSIEDMRSFIKKINAYKPVMMLAYVQSAYELACFIEHEHLEIYRMKSIIVSAGTLTPDFREKIEKVFGCPAFNRYGSREVGVMAMECSAHEGLHLNMFGQYMEIVDENDKPSAPGTMGRILITSLNNYTMPLLRFDIGDLATPSSKSSCACGRGLKLIESVNGRTVSVFKTKEGALVDCIYFMHLFYEYSFVCQYQLVQEDFLEIYVRYVHDKRVEKEVLQAMEKDIEAKIIIVMGEGCRVIFEQLDEIPPTDSGKFFYTLSKI